MANQIPLSEGVNAAGGFLVPQQLREALISRVNRQAAALSLSQVSRINTNRASWPVYLGRPAVGIVGEGATKPLTGAEFSEITIAMKKVAAITVYTEELLNDARIDPQVLVNNDIQEAFSDFIDKALIGTHPGGTSTQAYFDGSFANAAGASQDVLSNTTLSVGLDETAPDGFALALSAAMEQVEANGYEPNGILVSFAGKRLLRDARDTTKRPLYTEGFVKDVDTLMGMNLAFTTNLTGSGAFGNMSTGVGAPARIVAIVGDFRNSKAVIRNDITTRTSTEATLSAAPGHNLFEQNKMAMLWEMRMGYTVFDLNRSFCKIVNATSGAG